MTQTPDIRPATGARRSAPLAAFLSFLIPGLGQAYADRPLRGLVFAIPIVAVVAVVLVQLAGGLESFALSFLTPAIAGTFGLLAVATAAWRLLAMGDAVQVTDRTAWRRPGTLATFGVLGLITILVHGSLAWGLYSAYDASSRIFSGGNPDASPGASGDPDDLFPDRPVGPTPAVGERLTVLIVGIDNEPGRGTNLTDTMIVASIDPETGATSMISIPRDLSRIELPDGRIYNGKINSLMNAAARNPAAYPDGPLPTLMGALGHLVGVPIPYYAAINLPGFVKMVDAVGGVDVVNGKAINDPGYGGWTDGRPVGFRLSAGPHHLDGQEALAYARSRKGAGDNDFTRARRQQEVLLALRKRLTDPTVLPQIPSLIGALGDTVRTNFPSDRVGEVLDLARGVNDDGVERVVLGPRKYADQPPLSETGGLYVLVPKMAAVKKLSIDYYGEDSRYWTPPATPSPSPSAGG